MTWPMRRLGDLLSLEYGKPLPERDRDPHGAVPAFGANGVLCRTNKSYDDGPSIIVGRKGSAGEVTLVEEAFWPTDVTYFVRHDEAVTDLRYLYYLLLFLNLPSLAKGVKPGINRNDVYALSAACPPLREQKRIVAILDEAFEGIRIATANAQKNLANARELFEAGLEQVFDNVDRPRQRLSDIVTRLTNGYVGPTRDIYIEQGIPYLLARHVRDNHLAFDGKTFVSEAFNEKHKKSKLRIGDVLLVQSGHIGHCAVVGPEHEGHNCHAMIVISPVDNVLIGEFLSFYFCSGGMKRKFEEIRSGSTVPHLTCGLVRELMIPLPSIEEQQRLVEVLRNLERRTAELAEIAQRRMDALPLLKQSILSRAFSGQLAATKGLAA